jgi:hypothetical protein
MKRTKHTKKQYTELFDNPKALFQNVKTTLWPNGVPEIWFSNDQGYGFRVAVSNGPAGMGITISRFIGTPGLTISGNQADSGWSSFIGPDMQEVSLTQYKPDDQSQAFKRWYQSDASERDENGVALLADDILPLNGKE